jgi:hypothetical protein
VSAPDGWDDLLLQLSPEVAALVTAADELVRLNDGGLLDGTGQNMRTMTVRSVDALADPRLVPLLQAARRERLTALGRG